MYFFNVIKKNLPALALVTCLFAFSGCTTMLAGAIVYKIVKTIQASKKPHPDKNKDILVYAVWVEDPRDGTRYLVEVELLREIEMKAKTMHYTVERAFVTFEDRKQAKISIRDHDGDSFIDNVLVDEKKYGPSVPYTSEKYKEAQEKNDLPDGVRSFKLEKRRMNPWFSFTRTVMKGEEEKGGRINVYAYQLKFDSIVISTLQHLDLYSLKITGS